MLQRGQRSPLWYLEDPNEQQVKDMVPETQHSALSTKQSAVGTQHSALRTQLQLLNPAVYYSEAEETSQEVESSENVRHSDPNYFQVAWQAVSHIMF